MKHDNVVDKFEQFNQHEIRKVMRRTASGEDEGHAVRLSLTKNVQRHDPSKLLKIIIFFNMILFSLDKIFRIVVINFCGTVAPLSVMRHFWSFTVPSSQERPLEDALNHYASYSQDPLLQLRRPITSRSVSLNN